MQARCVPSRRRDLISDSLTKLSGKFAEKTYEIFYEHRLLHMICPNCNEEMERGILLNNGTGRRGYTYIRWLPKGSTTKKLFLPFTKKGVKKCGGEVIKLYSSDLAMPKYTDTYICKKCRKLVVDY